MAKKTHDPFKNLVLDEEEQEIEESTEPPTPLSPEQAKLVDDAIENHRRYLKNKSISLRIEGNELSKIKQKAETEGLPYQTLITSVLHKYVRGQLLDKEQVAQTIALMKK